MKKCTILFIIVLFLLAGCSGSSKPRKQVLAKINTYEIAPEEFEEAFKNSVFGLSDTLESRRQFLTILINQKLILQEAQKQGLDREGKFLKSIESFWEQSLLRVTLDKKIQEVSSAIRVEDREIQEAYERLAKEGKAEKPLAAMYGQLKWEIAKRKEEAEINSWLYSLLKDAHVEINYDLLKKDK